MTIIFIALGHSDKPSDNRSRLSRQLWRARPYPELNEYAQIILELFLFEDFKAFFGNETTCISRLSPQPAPVIFLMITSQAAGISDSLGIIELLQNRRNQAFFNVVLPSRRKAHGRNLIAMHTQIHRHTVDGHGYLNAAILAYLEETASCR